MYVLVTESCTVSVHMFVHTVQIKLKLHQKERYPLSPNLSFDTCLVSHETNVAVKS